MEISILWVYRYQKEVLIEKSREEISRISNVIKGSLKAQMMRDNRNVIQGGMETIKDSYSISNVFLIDKICHTDSISPEENTVIMENIFRNVNPINNENPLN